MARAKGVPEIPAKNGRPPYLCDHLGTPNALTNDRGQIEWAAMLDAWGNVKAEHNPRNLYQPIRLPGQHDDIATGIAYNRHRYMNQRLGFMPNRIQLD